MGEVCASEEGRVELLLLWRRGSPCCWNFWAPWEEEVDELLLAVEQGRGAATGRPWSRKVEVGQRWKKDAELRGFGCPGCWPSREEHGKAPWEKLELAAMGESFSAPRKKERGAPWLAEGSCSPFGAVAGASVTAVLWRPTAMEGRGHARQGGRGLAWGRWLMAARGREW
jgi:hypothetical protein